MKKRIRKTASKVFSITLILIILSSFALIFAFTYGVNLDTAALSPQTVDIKLFDIQGGIISEGERFSRYAERGDLNENVVKAFVTLEDKRFYAHRGADYIRLGGAVVSNIKAGYYKEGGSTITQQLAKNTHLSNEKTFKRKLKEAKIAREIEKKYTKDEILTMYLNEIYFGSGLYGIKEASYVLFDKEVKDLTLAEACLLAGIIKNPSAYSPVRHPDKASERKDFVLSVLLNEQVITETEYMEGLEYVFQPVNTEREYQSYADAAVEEAANILGVNERELLSGGYSVYTYQDKNAQRIVDVGIKNSALKVENSDFLAFIANNSTGGVSAYASSFGFSVHDFKRQPGSVIKPLAVYAPALNLGYISPSTPVLDEKTDFNGYSPSNYAAQYLGQTDIRGALVHSSNVIAVKILNEIGTDYGKYFSEKLGLDLSEDGDTGLSLALGGLKYGLTVPELTEAYMTLANYGSHKEVSFIKEIKNADGKVLYSKTDKNERVLSEESCYLLTDMLMDTVKTGTARKLSSLPFEIASKTGTAGISGSENNSDAWNLSYTSENTVCVWYGGLADKNGMPKNITGGSYPTLFAKYIHENLKKPQNFEIPNGIIELEIDSFATRKENYPMLASENTPDIYRKKELFDSKYAPDTFSTYFDNAVPRDLKLLKNDYGVEISFTADESFIYRLYKSENGGKRQLAEFSGVNGAAVYNDALLGSGVNAYLLEAYTAEGYFIGSTDEKSIYNFDFKDFLNRFF